MGDNHSLSDKVFHKLQEDILSGKYAVDEELKEKTIGDELGGQPDTGARGTASAGTSGTCHDHAEQGRACHRIFQRRSE